MSAILKQKLIDIANGFTKYGLWKGGGSGGSSALSDMTDVTFANLQANDVLKYNGSVWVNDDDLQTQINTLNKNLNEKILIVKQSIPNIEINANSVVSVGVINDLISIPNGYSIATIMPYSSSIGNCIPFIRVNAKVPSLPLEVYARNFANFLITTTIYIRVILIKI